MIKKENKFKIRKQFSVFVITIISAMFLINIGNVLAVDDLVALQGNVQESGVDLASGNLTVTIYDALTGGNMIYNSTTDFRDAISNGKYDVMLGNSTVNELSLEYGKIYYLELFVNNEKFTFNDGSTRQIFQSGAGQINASVINPYQINESHLARNINLGNATNILAGAVNKTTGTNWLNLALDSILDTIYNLVSGTNTTANLQSLLNATGIYSTYNATYALWSYNQTDLNTTWAYNMTTNSIYYYNQSAVSDIVKWLYNQSDTNTTWAYNMTTNSIYYYNQSLYGSQWFYNQTDLNTTWSYNMTTNSIYYYNFSTIDEAKYWYNMSGIDAYNYSLATYNQYGSNWYNHTLITNASVVANYGQWWYNMTTAGDTRFLKLVNAAGASLNVTGDFLINVTGDVKFGGGWQSNGVTISGGDIFAQTLYVYNISSLAVTTLYINGSIFPPVGFDDTFDIGSSSLQWNDLYLGTGDLYLGGTGQKQWWYNQSVVSDITKWLYNQTDLNTTWAYNMTTNSIYYYNQTLPAMTYGYNFSLLTNEDRIFNTVNVSGNANLSGLMYVNATMVGIGTPPEAKLHVYSGSAEQAVFSGWSDILSVENAASGQIEFGTNAAYKGQIQYNGNTGIFYIGNTYNSDDGDIVFLTKNGGVIPITIKGSGKVGIGTTVPNATLHVVGTANISGQLTVGEVNVNQWLYNMSQFDAYNYSLATENQWSSNWYNHTITANKTVVDTYSKWWYNHTLITNASMVIAYGSNWYNHTITANKTVVETYGLYNHTITANKTVVDTYSKWWYNQTLPALKYEYNFSLLTNEDRIFRTVNVSGNVNLSGILYTKAGLIGIGTSNPSNTLDVEGCIRSTSTSTPSGGAGTEIHFGGGVGNIYAHNRTLGEFEPLNIIGETFRLRTSSAGNVEGLFIDTGGKVGIGTITPTHTLNVVGNTNISGDLYIDGGDIFPSGLAANNPILRIGSTSWGGGVEIEDASLCVGDGGCTASTTEGRLFVVNSINVGDISPDDVAYNEFALNAQGPTKTAAITQANDVYIGGDLEVTGVSYLLGGYSTSDIAEQLSTKQTKDNQICAGDIECLKQTGEVLEYGDAVCIDPTERHLIMRCEEANSRLVVGFVSNSTRILMGDLSRAHGGYPIALAGIVWVKMDATANPILPGDLLVTSPRPGYVMVNNEPKPGTVVAKSFGFCNKDAKTNFECRELAFIALS